MNTEHMKQLLEYIKSGKDYELANRIAALHRIHLTRHRKPRPIDKTNCAYVILTWLAAFAVVMILWMISP